MPCERTGGEDRRRYVALAILSPAPQGHALRNGQGHALRIETQGLFGPFGRPYPRFLI